MGYLVAGQFECGCDDRPPFRLLPLRDHILLARANPLASAFYLDGKRAIFIYREKGFVFLQLGQDLLDLIQFSAVLGICTGEHHFGFTPPESRCFDSRANPLTGHSMPGLIQNAVQIIHFPGCPVYSVGRRRRVKRRKQKLLRQFIISAFCVPTTKELRGSSVPVAIEIPSDSTGVKLQAFRGYLHRYPF